MVKKREHSDIVLDILISIQEKKGKIKPTHLMYKANLAHQQMKLYLGELLQKNFIKKINNNGSDYITITETGLKFVEKIRQMKEFERTFGL